MSRKSDVDDALEILFQQVDDNDTQFRRDKLLVLLFHIVAVLNRIHNRRVRTRPADALFFQRLDEAGFGIAGRRLREVLRRFYSLIMNDGTFFDVRQLR